MVHLMSVADHGEDYRKSSSFPR